MAKTKLVVHCGTHKTATSAFQAICCQNQAILKAAGVYYPKIRKKIDKGYLVNTQHSIIARSLSAQDASYAEQFFSCVRQDLGRNNCHTLLLSGEDFENILIDNNLLHQLVKISRQFDFKPPELVFTIRNPFDYFCSMYSELSRKRVVVDFKVASMAAMKTGFFSCPVETTFDEGLEFNGIFAIDAKRLVGRLSRQHKDIGIAHESFSSFVNPWPGFNLLSGLIDSSLLKPIDLSTLKNWKNSKLDDMQVEVNYTQNFLNLDRKLFNSTVDEISRHRLKERRKIESFIKNLYTMHLSG